MSSFEDEVTAAGNEMGGGSDFYKFKEGDNKIHILTEPKIQASRYGYGICYEGAPYCNPANLEKEYQAALEKARAAGEDLKKVKHPAVSKKWMCWAIQRSTAELVLVTLPYGVSKTLMEMKADEESGWTAWPMPFGINIKAKGAGKKEVEYTVVASRQNTVITEEELADLAKKTPVDQILDRQKAKQKDKTEGTNTAGVDMGPIEYPEEDINPDDIPF